MGAGAGLQFFSLSPFDQARFNALTEGLEVAVVSASAVARAAATLRIDSEYFRKSYLRDAELVLAQAASFTTLPRMGVTTDASAFYPSIEADYGKGKLPFVRVSDVNGLVDVASCLTIPEGLPDIYPTLNRVYPGDILFTKGGAIDRVGILAAEAAASRDLISLATSKLPVIDRLFYFAFFQTNFFKRSLVRSSSQTAQPHLTLGLIRELPVLLASTTLKDIVAEFVQLAFTQKDAAAAAQREAEGALLGALGLAGWSPPEPLTYTRSAAQARSAGRLDAQFHAPAVTELRERLAANFELISFDKPGEVINGRTVTYAEDGTIPMIRSGDVGKRLERASLLRAKADQPIAYVRNGDVLISSIGFGSIGRVHVVHDDLVTGTVSEVTIIRQTTLEPDYLTAFLKSSYGQMQIERFITGATGQLHLYPRDVRSIFVPLVSEKVQTRFRAFAATQEEWLARSRALLAAATRAVEVAIEEGEPAALAFLTHVRKSIDAAAA